MSTYRRVPRAPLSIYLNKFVGSSVFMCRAANISEGGIFLARLIEPEHAKSDVSLEFALPGDEEVIWAHRLGGPQGNAQKLRGHWGTLHSDSRPVPAPYRRVCPAARADPRPGGVVGRTSEQFPSIFCRVPLAADVTRTRMIAAVMAVRVAAENALLPWSSPRARIFEQIVGHLLASRTIFQVELAMDTHLVAASGRRDRRSSSSRTAHAGYRRLATRTAGAY